MYRGELLFRLSLFFALFLYQIYRLEREREGNVEWPVNLTLLTVSLWTAGRSQSTWTECTETPLLGARFDLSSFKSLSSHHKNKKRAKRKRTCRQERAGVEAVICASVSLFTQNDTNASKLQHTLCAIVSSVYLYENILMFDFPVLNTQQRYTVTSKYRINGKCKEERCKKRVFSAEGLCACFTRAETSLLPVTVNMHWRSFFSSAVKANEIINFYNEHCWWRTWGQYTFKNKWPQLTLSVPSAVFHTACKADTDL